MRTRQSPVERDSAESARSVASVSGPAVTLLTGGIDRPYVFGLSTELASKGAQLGVIGSDSLDFPEFHTVKGISFLNLQGSQRPDVSSLRKLIRLSIYYIKMISYVARSKAKIVHILWNNKFELFDRTLLMLYFKLLKKKIVLTAHNVNKRKRDSKDSYLNRATLRFQYRIADHIFVHTESARSELIDGFGVRNSRITVIPFGINNAVPITDLSESEARQRLGIGSDKKVLLFFGRITRYKGLDCLIEAFRCLLAKGDDYVLVVAGRPENDYRSSWSAIQEEIRGEAESGRIILRADHIPDEETEVYFKAADVLVLPYRQIYQSGVLFLGYSFGLPIVASDLSSLKDEIIDGKTGFTFKAADPNDLAAVIESYFSNALFTNLNRRRGEIREFAKTRHSWDTVGQRTILVYKNLVLPPLCEGQTHREESPIPAERPSSREIAHADRD